MKSNRIVAVLLAVVAGCAVRVGGSSPQPYDTLALAAGSEPAAAVAARIREAGAELVLLSATADSAWFAQVAAATALELSGPGEAGGTSLAFLGPEPVGDTTIALPLEGGGRIIVHDALYRVDKSRFLDLLAVRLDSETRVRDAVRALLAYIATDVMHEAAVVFAVETPTAAVSDSVTALLAPAFEDAADCVEGGRPPAGTPLPMRLFYGPEVRIDCESARLLEGASRPVLARLVVSR